MTGPRAALAFDGLGRTRRYALVLEVVTARTEKGRASQLRRIVASLESVPGVEAGTGDRLEDR